MSQPRPEQIARHTVEQNGGEYVTDVPDLLSLFGRQQLNDRARQEVRDALQREGVGTDPDLFVAERNDQIRLFLLQAQEAPTGWSVGPSIWSRLLPRTWKGWLAYGVVLVVAINALGGDSDDARDTAAPASNVTAQEEPRDDANAAAAREERRAARRARERLRRERAQLRRERAQARRERARIRRAEAAAARERERQQQLQAEAIAAEEAAAEAASACHPSYDPCLNPNSSDYDCEGGSGDGPEYTGYVTVSGTDDYGLDSDGDGTGCES